MGDVLVGVAGVGLTLVALFALEARGVLTVNTKALRGLIIAGGLYVGWRFLTILGTFI